MEKCEPEFDFLVNYFSRDRALEGILRFFLITRIVKLIIKVVWVKPLRKNHQENQENSKNLQSRKLTQNLRFLPYFLGNKNQK